MSDASCPSCFTPLAKVPQRKSKCRHCGEFIYVKATPDNPTKRLMNAAQAEQAERMWTLRSEEMAVQADAAMFGIETAALRQSTEAHGGDRYAALVEQLLPRAIDGDERAARGIGLRARDPQVRLAFDRLCTTLDLVEHLNHRSGIVAGVQLKPREPWAAGIAMITMHRDGLDIATISQRTGYSVWTVERAIAAGPGGTKPRAACDQLEGKVINVRSALCLLDIPCDKDCNCSWKPVYASEATPARYDVTITSSSPEEPLAAIEAQVARRTQRALVDQHVAPPAPPILAALPAPPPAFAEPEPGPEPPKEGWAARLRRWLFG